MDMRRSSAVPTEVELEILQVLWRLEKATVRQVHNAVLENRHTAYNTTLTMLQVMTAKGLVLKDESVSPQVYRPAQPQERTQLQMVDYLIQKGFAGSAVKLFLSAAAARRITPEELDEVRKLLGTKPAARASKTTSTRSKGGKR